MTNTKITKAVFPVAGLGTRFLPATKASPKEMLPIVDKPLIQYAVEEAINAGIRDLIFITGRNKRSIEDHFDKAYELESELKIKGKTDLLEAITSIVPKHVNCIYIRQTETLGLGHAILCAQGIINQEPFAVLLADELIDATPNALSQMIQIYEHTTSSVLGLMQVKDHEVSSYGIVKTNTTATNLSTILPIEAIVEKPSVKLAPSNLAVVGRYILTPDIFTHLANLTLGVGNELQLTDAIANMINTKHAKVYGHKIIGERYDCGSKLGYLKATVNYGLRHSELATDFLEFLNSIHNS